MIENKNISYLRIRPCDSDNEIYLNSRAKEGTSAFTLKPGLDIRLSKSINKWLSNYFIRYCF